MSITIFDGRSNHAWFAKAGREPLLDPAFAPKGKIRKVLDSDNLELPSEASVLWIAGIDEIGAYREAAFAGWNSLNLVPKRLVLAAAFRLSGLPISAVLIILGFLFWREGLGTISFLGLILIGLLPAYEHSLVRPRNLSRANTAFS